MNILVIGYGNLDRADDGVGYFIVNALRRRLGRRALEEGATGLEELGSGIDTVFLSQLAPEILEAVSGYEQLVFVDAHNDNKLGKLYCEELKPEYSIPSFSHHLTPTMLLALVEAFYDRRICGFLVSVIGCNFDFHHGLSPLTEALVESAVEKILELIGGQAHSTGS